MTHKRSVRKRKAFVWNLPTDLTSQLIDRIHALPSSVKADYLKEQFLTKFVSKDTAPPATRRNAALNKWLATEMENEATEHRLIITPAEYNILPRVMFSTFVEWCRNTICDIIGETPPDEALIGSFSGGASTSRSRTISQPAGKYVGEAHVTERALPVFESIWSELPGWLNSDSERSITIVPGNMFFTVPKKTDIDRVACKEPDLNMFLQKGIGTYFRRCLRRTGINLNDQSINRSFARIGSIDGSLATLDLSSASDSVTREFVELMLPETWFTLLDSVRSQVTIIDGEEHRNCMFSSMGNGFTFELESLLFLVLARATAFFTGTRGVVSIYGDDIICPTGIAADLSWVLGWFGFQVNLDKSFTSGPIRESCGGHYYNGYDITPFYIKGPITTLPELIDVANKLRQWGTWEGAGRLCGIIDPDIEDIWLWLKSMVPSYLWGGGDTSFKYQLVSNDLPVRRLYEETDRRSTGVGGYYHWLNTTWEREVLRDGIMTSSHTSSLSILRLRPVLNPAVPQLPAYFIHELG